MEGIYPKSEFLFYPPPPDCWFTSIPLGVDLYRSSTWLSVACRNLLHSRFHACSSSYFLIPPGTGQPLPYKPVHLTVVMVMVEQKSASLPVASVLWKQRL